MSRDHEAESLLLALSRFEREAAARLGVALAMGPRMAAALAQVAPGANVEQSGRIVHMGINTQIDETGAAHTMGPENAKPCPGASKAILEGVAYTRG